MFLYDNWYVAGFGRDLHPGAAQARRICDKPMVLFRTEDGRATALEDRCSHRAMPLSPGKCFGSVIQCPYHGIQFNADGECVKVPGQDTIPKNAGIQRYPLQEKNGLLWIWPGEMSRADVSLIPDYPIHDNPDWAWVTMESEVAADAVLVMDNLMDMSHITFVHDAVINGDPQAHTNAKMSFHPTEHGLEVIRHLPDSVPPPQYEMAGKFKGRIDRWQEFDFVPGLARFWTGGTDAGTGAYEGKREGGFQMRHMHGVTPKTATTCYYYFSVARNFMHDNDELAQKLLEGARVTIFEEDRPIIEAQQARINEDPTRRFIDIQADGPGLQVRRIMRKRLAQQEEANKTGALAA